MLSVYFERYALVSLEKRAKLEQLVGDHFMELDIDAGVARFSSGHAFPIQVLGTESENTLSWLWGWAEEHTEVPEHLLSAAQELKNWGIRNNITEFMIPSVDLDRADGTMLALISASVSKAHALYREHFEGGSLFLLLFGDVIERQPGFERLSFLRAVREITSVYTCNQNNLLSSYFRELKLPFSGEPSMISGELPSGERLIVSFNERGNITAINGDPWEEQAI